MKNSIRIVSLMLVIVLAFGLAAAAAETKNSNVEGTWNVIDIEVVHDFNGVIVKVNKTSLLNEYDISMTFKGGNYTIRMNDKSGRETLAYGTYNAGATTLTIHTEKDTVCPYYVVGDVLTLIEDNKTYTFLREGAPASAYKGGSIQGSWELTSVKETGKDYSETEEKESMLLEAIVWCAILGRTVSMDFDSPNRLCLSSGHPTEGTNDSVGSYSANGTLLSFSLPGDDEFFSYSVEGDTLKIGDDFFYMEFIRK